MLFVYILFAMLLAAIIGSFISTTIEKKEFNKGVCNMCGARLRLFDTDSHGGRGYTCDKCQYKVWVSYYSVDGDHLKDLRKFKEK